MAVKNLIVPEEFFRDEESLEHILLWEDYRKILLLVEMALETPEILFAVISPSTGFEAIEKARRSPQNGKGVASPRLS